MMIIKSIKNINQILKGNYSENGTRLDHIWASIYNSNLDFKLEETFEALIVVLQFLIENNLAYLMRYDEQQKKVIHWKGEGKDVLEQLRNYLANFTEKETEKNPAFLDMFEYPAIDWNVSWPLDLKKYGL